MKIEQKRIFINDLPETATESDIQKTFSEYGKVASIEIKERKELGFKHTSLFFAYINLETDDKTLQKCFQDFANEKWHGEYVHLQLARESFLDRLKREREENAAQNKIQVSKVSSEEKPLPTPAPKDNSLKPIKKQISSSEDSSSSSDEESTTEPVKSVVHSESENSVKTRDKVAPFKYQPIIDYDPDIIIKNNKNKKHDLSGLRIESVGKEPILTIEKTKRKTDTNTSAANLKRLESLKNLKKGYQNQKSLIQAALSNVDGKSKNKITFDDDFESRPKKIRRVTDDSKKALFNDESEDEDFEGNFNVKEQFQGKEGQKLLELQSKYKNDKRFHLDSRFRDHNEDETVENEHVDRDGDEMTIEDEVRKEYEILNEILGKKLTPRLEKKSESSTQKKSMLRFDPSQPEHSKYEVQRPVENVKKKKKKKKDIDELAEEKKQEDKEAPAVSKEVFYKVHDNLKESLHEKNEFSLLNMFGRPDVTDDTNTEEPVVNHVAKKRLVQEKDPFRYESSDDEDETGHIPNNENLENDKTPKQEASSNKRNFWVEPFFFKKDDYRLQEGYDFLQRMKSGEEPEFKKLRRDIRQIVKAKVRNNQQKNKPFKRKLGGNKKKKMLRMKRALKR